MQKTATDILIAIDVGNSRAKWGLFVDGRLTEIASFATGESTDRLDEQLARWQPLGNSLQWAIASVNAAGAKPIRDWLDHRRFTEPCILNDPRELPLRVELERPEAVGIDRLLDAIAANSLRPVDRGAVIVDAGSAITVDAVSPYGSFVGGSIAIGLGLAARALHEFTDLLPLVTAPTAPVALGKSTADALRSGLFWGSVGAVKELVSRVSKSAGPDPVILLTGGDGERLAEHIDRPVEFVPHLTLQGINLAYSHRAQRHVGST